jgi:dihydrolipoamide dehydrogenase
MYDLAIIGAGWAGFNAALRAKKAGLSVALIDKAPLGGTCLNRGCIPTKALIQSAKVYSLSKKAATFGVTMESARINLAEVQSRKDKIIQQLRQGMQSMLTGIDCISGQAEFVSSQELLVSGQSLKAKNFLIASGSRPYELKDLPFDGKKVLSSDHILSLNEIPRSLLIVGGGVIGCEFASFFTAIGCQVTIVELLPQILPQEDKEVVKKLETTFKKKGVKVNTSTDAKSIDITAFDLILVCVGRIPNTDGLGLERANVNLDKGKIQVDQYLRTSNPAIYAAGDVTGKVMLAHYAAYQGEIAAENSINAASPQPADNPIVPNCIFTDPEIASVGLCEEAARSEAREIEVRKFDFLASGMARILDETDGFIKVILDKNTGILIGASIIGPRATELIATFGIAISSKLTVQQFKHTIFAHPTLSESIGEVLS